MEKNEPAKVMGAIEKNTLEEIRFAIIKWHGMNFVDVRVFVKADASEGRDEIALKKGVRFNAELLPEFIEILQKIDRDLAGETGGDSAKREI
jgi:hypothetical protein